MKLARKWILVATLLLSMAMVTTGTLAYLTDTDTRTNTFTMGKVDISIVETDVDNKLTPDATANKDAEIKNNGDTDAYVWMTVVLDENLDKLLELSWNGYTPEKTVENGEAIYLVKYDEVLAAGASTGKILDAVTMKGNVDVQGDKLVLIENGQIVATYEGARDNLQVTVNAYAVQADGMNGVDDAYSKYYAQWGPNGGGTSGEGTTGPTTDVTTAAGLNNALSEGGNVNVKGGISLEADMVIPADTNANINLNGNTITTTQQLVVGGDAVIENGTIVSNNTTRYDYSFMNQDDAKVTYDNLVMTANSEGGVAAIGNSVVEVNNCTLTFKPATTSRHMFYAAGNGEITINGGTYKYDAGRRGCAYFCVDSADSKIIVNGGTFTGYSKTNADPVRVADGGEVIIKAGTFDFDPTAWLAEGSTVAQNGSLWTVTAAE